MQIHFGHRLGNYDPSTELSREFCAGIGPLQLGVVLVSFLNKNKILKIFIKLFDTYLILIHSIEAFQRKQSSLGVKSALCGT